jgi:ADP-ribose pyrophosphatase YjhB (NUDIX family)
MIGIPNAASVALIDRDKVLLIQRARAPYFGLWTLPGGRLEPGEDAETAAAREIKEEVGLRCFALRPIRRMILGDGKFVLQVFATEAFEGEIVASDEVTDYRWVRLDEIGRFKTTDGLGEVLERAFAIFDRT